MGTARHQGEQFPAEIRDAARALMVVHGLSSRKTEQALAQMFPDSAIPHHSSLALWRSSFAEIRQEELELIEQNERERILLCDELIGDALNLVKNQGSMGTIWSLKNLYSLNAIRGTDTDKIIKRSQTTTEHRPDQRLVFVFNGSPQIIAPDTELPV